MNSQSIKHWAGKILGAAAKYTLTVVLIVYCVSLLIPLAWLLISSFKDEFGYALRPLGLPDIWYFKNYVEVFSYMNIKVVTAKGTIIFNFLDLAFNSLVRAVGTPLIFVFFQTICAYTIAKYKFRGSNFIYMLGLVIMILPIVGSLPSSLMIHKALGLYDNMYPLMLMAPAVVFGMNFLILYSSFKNIPWDYAEAAFIDGAGHWRVMLRIMIPMMFPTCVVLFVLGFLGTWNDYMTVVVMLPSYPNLAYGLYIFQYQASVGGQGASTPMVLTAFVIVMLPTVALYLAAQKFILQKFIVGGLKG